VSTVLPRDYVIDVSDTRKQSLHTVRCPFCDEPMETRREPEFRSHLRTDCEEAPREPFAQEAGR